MSDSKQNMTAREAREILDGLKAIDDGSELIRFDGAGLLDTLRLADVLDVPASEVRRLLKEDPASLPEPLRFGPLIRWPAQQIMSWLKAGSPRSFDHGPGEFVPASIFAFSDNHPTGCRLRRLRAAEPKRNRDEN